MDALNEMNEPLLVGFGVAVIVCALVCLIALQLFSWFRSGERKEGNFKPDQSAGTYEIGKMGEKGASGTHNAQGEKKERRRGGRRGNIRVSTSELPLLGGPALLLGTLAGVIGVSFWLNFSFEEWKLLGILLIGLVGFGLVGFIDDWRKVYRGSGITEIQKLIGVALVSLAAAIAFHRLLDEHGLLTARFAYPPYSEIPWLGKVLQDVRFTWPAFFLMMTVLVGTTTSLAVDFSDGMDGLAGGLLLSASLAFSVILLNQGTNTANYAPLALVTLAIAGASLGYLPFNWPSSWRARTPGPKRRARLIMGDSGSLALGGVLALVAIISRLEALLIIIGGVFVLEGLSALVSARILVRFFRRFLTVERYGKMWYPHTEFPLPFLATPMHHHFDLLHWDRQRIVYSAWLVGALLGTLGVASVLAPTTWERYLARLLGLIVIIVLWEFGPWTRSFFVGLARKRNDPPNSARRLALFYGYPYRLFGRPLYYCVDITSVRENALESPAEELSLWQRMSVFDARALLGFYCYRADALEDAERVWSRLPKPNLQVRPDIEALVDEVKVTLAVRRDNESSSGAHPGMAAGDAGARHMPSPSPTRLEPTDATTAPPSRSVQRPTAPLWSAAAWSAATNGPALGQEPSPEYTAGATTAPQPAIPAPTGGVAPVTLTPAPEAPNRVPTAGVGADAGEPSEDETDTKPRTVPQLTEAPSSASSSSLPTP